MSSDAASVRRRDGGVVRGYETPARLPALPLHQPVRGVQVQVDHGPLEGQRLDLAGGAPIVRYLYRPEDLERHRP